MWSVLYNVTFFELCGELLHMDFVARNSVDAFRIQAFCLNKLNTLLQEERNSTLWPLNKVLQSWLWWSLAATTLGRPFG